MHDLHFIGLPTEYTWGLSLLEADLDFRVSPEGLPIEVQLAPNLHVEWDGKAGRITAREKAHFFRGLTLLLDMVNRGEPGFLEEEPRFEKVGAMVDASRNAVMRPEAVEFLLRKMTCMGLNVVMLYTEDTYEIKDYPYFGYMRGRYTAEEIRKMDQAADALGIELVPCIQTLGHLGNVLKWEEMGEYRDTANVLLCEEEKVYDFIESMIVAASTPIQSRRIHIGMDEAMDLGLGKYLQKHGYEDGFSLLERHLARIVEICERHGLSPLIWSDMYFRLASSKREYYDLDGKVPPDVIDRAPKQVGLVYWDYYHTDEAFYREYIHRHQKFSNPLSFAGGLWTWVSPAIHYGEAFRTSLPALRQCRESGVTEVLATMWGDDGTECCGMAALLGLQLYAEASFQDTVSMSILKRRFYACTHEDPNAFLAISRFDVLDDVIGRDGLPPKEAGNVTRLLLYADPLLNLFEKDFEGLDFVEHYRGLAAEMENHAAKSYSLGELFRFYADLAMLLADKCCITSRIRNAYEKNDHDWLEELLNTSLPQLRDKLDRLRASWRKLWFIYYKAPGFEVLDIRMGGLSARLDTAAERIRQWMEGDCDRLEELEGERLPFARVAESGNSPHFEGVYAWQRMVSASNI